MGGSYYKIGRWKHLEKRFLMGNFIIKDQWENQEQNGRTCSEEHITDPRNKKMEVSPEEGQGPEGAVMPCMDE